MQRKCQQSLLVLCSLFFVLCSYRSVESKENWISENRKAIQSIHGEGDILKYMEYFSKSLMDKMNVFPVESDKCVGRRISSKRVGFCTIQLRAEYTGDKQ